METRTRQLVPFEVADRLAMEAYKLLALVENRYEWLAPYMEELCDLAEFIRDELEDE